MGAVDLAIADEILAHAIDLFRVEASSQQQILRLITELRRELTALLQQEDLTAFTKARTEQLLRQASAVIDGYYAKIEGESVIASKAVGEVQAKHVVSVLNDVLVHVEASLPTETFLARLVTNALIEGSPASAWWSRQSLDTGFRFANAVRAGLAAGETNADIVRRVAGGRGQVGVLDVSLRNARSLVHTAVQTVANAARRETFRKNADVIQGIRQLSTLDGRTTPVCIGYSGAEWDLDGKPINGTKLPYGNGVPRHWGCRSVEVPITKTFRELGIDLDEAPETMRAASGGPVSSNITFDEWLSRRTVEQQDEQLGAGRAQLWRAGKISLAQLLDLQGNPMSVRQLQAKYGG